MLSSRCPIVIGIATVLHLFWAVGLAVDPASQNTTSVFALMSAVRDTDMASVVLFIIASLALTGFVGFKAPWVRVTLIVPQQAALTLSAIGASNAMYLSHFADLVERSRWFIINDQIPMVLLAAGHFVALMLIARTK